MKKISRNPWLKLAAFILCSLMIAGLGATAFVAALTGNYTDVASIRSDLFENIAGRYSKIAVQDYLNGDDEAFKKLGENTNMSIAVVKSNESDEDKVDDKKSDNQVYSSTSTISDPDYIFCINAKNRSLYHQGNLLDAMSYRNYSTDEAYLEDDEPIDTMAYSVESGLFYIYIDNGESYIIPKVKIYLDTDNGTESQQYKLAEKTDENGNTYYEYENTFSGEALSKSGYKDWYEVDCYDSKGNYSEYCIDAENNIEGDIYISEQITGDFEVLPESYTISSNGYIDIPLDDAGQEFYWVYVKMPGGSLHNKGDYFNQLDNYLKVMSFIEDNVTALFILFILGFIVTAGYLLTVAGKRPYEAGADNDSTDNYDADNVDIKADNKVDSNEIKLRLYDRIPYEIVTGATWLIIFVLMCGCYVMIKEIVVVAVLVLLAICVGLEWLLSSFVRIRAHKFWRYTLCYYVAVMIWRPVKKICKSIEYAFSLVKTNTPLFVIGCAIFFGLCLLELIGIATESIGFIFIIKLIEFVMLVTFIMQFDKIRKAAKTIANGDFSHPVDTSHMLLFFKQHGEDLNNVSNGIEAAVSEKMKSERFRTELITNVSHDIKTPLTSIINYVDLLQKEDIDNENVRTYLEVLDRQSSRLKKLIEDLMEASKASTGSIKVELEELDATVMISQIAAEYQEKFQKKNLDLIIENDVSPVMISADGRHLWRVFDNLMNNINKYAQPGTRVYVDIIPKDTGAVITFKNISECPLNISSDELMERFVRGDSSRNTEGSGLGLSIAESLMKLMNGTMELAVDGDLFKVTLEF